MKKLNDTIKKEKKFLISMALLFIGNGIIYWLIKLFQRNPIYIDFYLDDKIPFWGWLIYIYNMFYPFCIFVFYLLYKKDEKAYYKGIIACLIGCFMSHIIFLIVPTIMYRPTIPNYDAFTNLVLKITYFFDEPPLNCFPSIHCIFCFQVIFSYIKSNCTLKRKTWVILGASLIIISTLFVKQHYIFDIVAAFLICLIANILESIFKIYDDLKRKKII